MNISNEWIKEKTKLEDGCEVGAGLLALDPASVEQAERRGRPASDEDCPGHVASKLDPKICQRCGVHIDSLRPDYDC